MSKSEEKYVPDLLHCPTSATEQRKEAAELKRLFFGALCIQFKHNEYWHFIR